MQTPNGTIKLSLSHSLPCQSFVSEIECDLLAWRASGLLRRAKRPFEHLGQTGSDLHACGGSSNASIASLTTDDLARTGLLGEGDLDLVELGKEVEGNGSNISCGWEGARETSLGQVARDETLLGGGQRVVERVVVVLGLGAVGDTGELVGAAGSLFGTGPVLEASDLSLRRHNGDGGDDGQKKGDDSFHHDEFVVAIGGWLAMAQIVSLQCDPISNLPF
jgi:hypothetical protein